MWLCQTIIFLSLISKGYTASQQSNFAKNWNSFIDGHVRRLNGFVKKVLGEFSTTTVAPTTTAVYQTNLSETGDAYIQKIYDICGKVPPGRSTELIVKDTGGQFSVPWVVSLGFYQNNVYYHQCGGSLITSMHILTAAHCVATSLFDINRWVVRLGDRNLSSKTDDLNVKELGMRKAVMHPNFRRTRKVDKQSLYFDAAVIIMRTKVNSAFIPICLPEAAVTNPSSLTNQALTIVGYGIDDQEKIGRHLLKDTVAVREKDYCDEAHRNAGQDQERVNAALPDLFINSLFCADQDIDKKIGPCSGDSGSPAFQRIFKGGDRFVVQGIVSGAIECKSDRYPNFYTLVSSQDILPWIQKELFDSKDDDTTLYRFPNEDMSNIPCFEDSDCPKDHDFVCSPETQVCLKPSSTSYLYLNTANMECPTATPCLIRGSCNIPVCNRHDTCWCSAFQETTQEPETSSLEENECSGRQCQGKCECPTCTPYCVKRRCQKQQTSVQSQLLPHSTCSTNIYNFPSANTSDWDIPCKSEIDCPRDWFCSGRCYPPSSNPSGSSDHSLYVPTVSGLSYLSGSCTLCTQAYICPPLLPCSDGSHCVKPVCSPSIRGKPSLCWCDLFASQAKKTTSCLAVASCADIQQQIKRARQLGQAGRSGQIRRIQRFIRDNKCTMLDGKSGVLC
eukprot:GFUD01103070.1.p1 GENE.GFUD01103070.1~~GFUD01103070.1.p1  ORF type:complete len:673 (-),score=121.95 GFUD01103070.1:366-2384(-)